MLRKSLRETESLRYTSNPVVLPEEVALKRGQFLGFLLMLYLLQGFTNTFYKMFNYLEGSLNKNIKTVKGIVKCEITNRINVLDYIVIV